jgi:hypothetical protein
MRNKIDEENYFMFNQYTVFYLQTIISTHYYCKIIDSLN